MSYAEQGDLEIVVRGSKEDLDDFTLEKGSVSINLNDCKTAGTYNVPIQVTLPDGIELEDTINVQITLTKSSGGENDQKKGNDQKSDGIAFETGRTFLQDGTGI